MRLISLEKLITIIFFELNFMQYYSRGFISYFLSNSILNAKHFPHWYSSLSSCGLKIFIYNWISKVTNLFLF